MDPALKELADKYQERLLLDPLFSCRVKLIHKFLTHKDALDNLTKENAPVASYLLACILEETYDPRS